MGHEVATVDSGQLIADIVLGGDLSRLRPEQKVEYYNRFCESLGLNPLTRPFQYIKLSGKEVLYATKDATEQLRKINGVSVTALSYNEVKDVYVVTAHGQDKTGRTDTSTGAVTIGNLKGDPLANALMKAETKAKRRLTLSICGLGILDETDIETIHDAVQVDTRPVKEIVAEREMPDAEKARIEIEKLIDRYDAVLAPAYINATRMSMDGASIESLRRIYLDVRNEGKAAEAESEGGSGKVAMAKKFKATQLADEAEPVLPDETPMEPDDHADELF